MYEAEANYEFIEALGQQHSNNQTCVFQSTTRWQTFEFNKCWIQKRRVEQLIEKLRQLLNPSLQADIQELVDKFWCG